MFSFLVGILLLGFAIMLVVLTGAKSKPSKRPRSMTLRRTTQLRSKSIQRVRDADRAVIDAKSSLEILAREEAPQVHFMCVKASGISQIHAWLLLRNPTDKRIHIRSLDWEVWYGNFAKSISQEVQFRIPSHGQEVILDLEYPLTEEELLKLAKEDKKEKIRCYLEGLIHCETAYGEFQKRFALFDLTHTVTGLTLAKQAQGEDVKYELDSLTGLFLRRYLEENLQKMIDTSIVEHPFSFIMVDVDNFKNINDKYGHLVGDEALKMICQKIKDVIGDKGVAIRYGGDEFCVALQCCEKDEAEYLANRILEEVKKSKIQTQQNSESAEGGGEIHVALSLGVSTLYQQADYKLLLKNADDMLLQSKKLGKNQVMTDRRHE